MTLPPARRLIFFAFALLMLGAIIAPAARQLTGSSVDSKRGWVTTHVFPAGHQLRSSDVRLADPDVTPPMPEDSLTDRHLLMAKAIGARVDKEDVVRTAPETSRSPDSADAVVALTATELGAIRGAGRVGDLLSICSADELPPGATGLWKCVPVTRIAALHANVEGTGWAVLRVVMRDAPALAMRLTSTRRALIIVPPVSAPDR